MRNSFFLYYKSLSSLGTSSHSGSGADDFLSCNMHCLILLLVQNIDKELIVCCLGTNMIPMLLQLPESN